MCVYRYIRAGLSVLQDGYWQAASSGIERLTCLRAQVLSLTNKCLYLVRVGFCLDVVVVVVVTATAAAACEGSYMNDPVTMVMDRTGKQSVRM